MIVVAAGLVLAGCGSMVAGSPAGGTAEPTTTTTERATATRTITRSTTAEAPPTIQVPTIQVPTSIDDGAEQQYCEHTITGALGKQMQVVVVETPSGRVDCDQAGAVLVDYYAERPDPNPGSEQIEVAGFACNQVPEPDMPQVICTDGDSLLYSMWPQT